MRLAILWLVCVLYLVAGRAHIVNPEPFLTITPNWVAVPDGVIFWTGIAEILGAIALLQPFSLRLRKAAAIGLALYALCVWPANFNHMLIDMARDDGGWGLAYHVPRLMAQPVLIWATLWAGELIRWPFGRKSRH
ncbi:DoxX family protein [Aurantiacibacter gangjinensis]|uniref:DoxX family protein n=1 Tax=Aurantiacibacter gangjinensis TaxID=502682 RepID=UPI001F48326B|nr:DoxX family protein [Aurantiacibacter gangjinensis]